jgi:hypothetical protein
MPQPMAEQVERLEQLRLLAAGFRIRMQVVPPTGTGVDTPACLERVRVPCSRCLTAAEDLQTKDKRNMPESISLAKQVVATEIRALEAMNVRVSEDLGAP